MCCDSGMDVNAFIELLGGPQWAKKMLADALRSSWGLMAVTYVMYKMISPLRYLVTILGTHATVKWLVRTGAPLHTTLCLAPIFVSTTAFLLSLQALSFLFADILMKS